MKKSNTIIIITIIIIVIGLGIFMFANQSNNDLNSSDVLNKVCNQDSDCKSSCTYGCININQEITESIKCEKDFQCYCHNSQCVKSRVCQINSDCAYMDTKYQDPDQFGFCLNNQCVLSCSKDEYIDTCE